MTADRELVLAWLKRAQEPDIRNPAAFAATGIASGKPPGPRVREVRGSHGVSVKLEDDEPARSWNVFAYDKDDRASLVGNFDDRDEARRVRDEHDAKGGAYMEAVT